MPIYDIILKFLIIKEKPSSFSKFRTSFEQKKHANQNGQIYIMEKQEEKMSGEMLQKLLDAGAHLGHKKSKGHPKMKPYIFTTRQGVQIINIEKTAVKIQEAGEFLRQIISGGGTVLFVATTIPAKFIVKKIAEEINMPYVSERWLGGTLTNFKVISKRLEYFISQEQKMAKGEFAKYSKKEQADIKKEIEDLKNKMGGIKSLKQLPNALFIVDMEEHKAAVKEAGFVGAPIVAICDTNNDPSLAQFSIPASDKSVKSLQLVMDALKNIIKEPAQANKQEEVQKVEVAEIEKESNK